MTRLLFATAASLACGMAVALAKNDGGGEASGGSAKTPSDDIRTDAPPFDVESLADLLAERLFDKIEALAARDESEPVAPGADVPDGTPRNKVLFHLERIEELLNEDFRTGGDTVIATHVAFGALKRQAMHLPELAKPT